MNNRMSKKMLILAATLFISVGMLVGTNGCYSGLDSNSSSNASSLSKAGTYPSEGMFPSDFPPSGHDLSDPGELIGGMISGFGGDSTKSRSEHSLSRRPIILVHGNGGSATHATWGFQYMVPRLIDIGYKKDEIWAISYLGSGSTAFPPDPYAKNVDDFRRWIAAVMDYLNVDKVDIIGHSLGGVLVRAWAEGYTSSQTYGAEKHRDKIGVMISIAAANYGFSGYSGEWDPGHVLYQGINNSEAVAAYTNISIRAIGDFVDNGTPFQTPTIPGFGKSTSLLVGAFANHEFNVPEATNITSPMVSGPGKKHANAIRWEPLFTQAVAPYLVPDKSITFNPSSDTVFEGSLNVKISVNGYESASYVAKDDQGNETTGTLDPNGTTEITITESTTFDVSAYEAGSSTPDIETSPTYTKDQGCPIISFDPDAKEQSVGTVVTITANRGANKLVVTYNGETSTYNSNTATVTLNQEGTATINVTATIDDACPTSASKTYEVSDCNRQESTNDAHVTAGRAYTETSAGWWWFPGTTTYYAKGSNANLGTSGTTTVVLHSEDGGNTWLKGECGGGPETCSHCTDYFCCTSFGCAGYSWVNGGMKCYVMSGFSMAQCDCWQ